MPFLGREKGRSPRSRRSDDEFVLFLQGIPAHCRWQELKDLVRQTALHIRQAVVYDDSHGIPTGLGQIIVKNEDEAWRTYHRLSTNGWDGQSLVVTLARTSAPTKPIAGPTRSPPAVESMQNYTSGHTTPPRSQGNLTVPPSPISPESINSASSTYPYPDYAPMMGPMAIPTQHFMPMMPDHMAPPMQCFPPSPLMRSPMYDNQGWNMVPMYPVSPLQLVHDVGDGYARQHPLKPWANYTEPNSPTSGAGQRAVYIQNLHTTTTAADLKTFLQGAGTVEQCNVAAIETLDNRNQFQSQPHGSAIMRSIEEAKQAVALLNNTSFMGAQIRVQMDNGSSTSRSRSWDSAMTTSEDLSVPNLEFSHQPLEIGKIGQELQNNRTFDPHKPLVVDGSGMQKRSLELLSTSAPT
ncbi:Nucleotide-binding alpha-beta plait [Penicillium atrosanguineum]|uniref:Nucleotide-binding alpha-beta plait n=1 Tax=Penicillium atrosanguineum TaxID=1132637 RepID=A0A9W9H848_9EURO|nr:Nucleotide-binding alpha-beta plait [Penicillium atrosanguineum]KAJ5139504.1 Nucleotide-binding alpha-beta plait [Penicillium atrosanguineum]KAJ5314944.1 Nucleotide-binding alpha-beta plait [Penicillium atrosanguineum]